MDTPDKTEEKPMNPYVKGIIDSMEKVVPPEPGKLPVVPAPPSMSETSTIGETVVTVQERKKSEAAANEAKESAKETPEDKTKVEEPKKETPPAVDQRPIIKLVRKAEPVATPPKPEEPPKKEPTADELAAKKDEEFIQTLTPEQQEELAVAKFAESKGKNGLQSEFIAYYRKIDQFIEAHPDMDPEGDDYKKFIRENRPKVTDTEMRRLERQMIQDEAAAKAREEAKAVLEPVARELKETKLTPVINQTVSTVEKTLTTADPDNKDLVPIDSTVVECIKTDGFEKAAKKFPVEAPIVQGTINATREWMRLSNGLTTYDEANPVHNWLATFIASEGANMMKEPESVRMRDGLKFVPLHVFTKLQRDNPQEAAKCWTFSDEMITDLIANRGLLSYNDQISTLKQSGWTKEPPKVSTEKEKPPGEKAAPAPAKTPESTGSPKAGARALPGAGETEIPPNPNLQFIEGLVPGAGKIIATR